MPRFVVLLWLLPLLLAPVLGCDSSTPSASPKKVAKAGSAKAGPATRPHITSATLRPSEPVPGQALVMRYEVTGKDGAALTAGFLWHLNDRRLSNAGPELIVRGGGQQDRWPHTPENLFADPQVLVRRRQEGRKDDVP